MGLTIDGTIALAIGVAVFAIVVANIVPTQLNAMSATTLTNTSANALWTLLPLILVVALVLYVVKNKG